MEHLVYGISTINFEHNDGITKENCAPNRLIPAAIRTFSNPCTFMVEPMTEVCDFNCLPPVSINHFETLAMSTHKAAIEPPTPTEELKLSGANDSEADEEACSSLSKNIWLRRKLPARASKESTLPKTNRRSIVKPTKRGTKSVNDFTSLRPADIKKIYLNKKLTNFHPAKLETILEEPQSEVSDAESQVQFIGTRKLKRSLSFCDGINMNKTRIKQRRNKIKKSFGQRSTSKKTHKERESEWNEFVQRLNKSFDSTTMEEEDHQVKQIETETEQPSTMETMDSEETKETQSSVLNDEETVPTKLLQPIADSCGVLVKSDSFSDDHIDSQTADTHSINIENFQVPGT